MRFLLLAILAFQAQAFVTENIKPEVSLVKLLANINPADTVSGVVVASPSRQDPDYFFHWVRDAALVMSTVFDLHQVEKDQGKKRDLLNKLKTYALRAKSYQQRSSFEQLGEPKYNVDGSLFTGPWGRPQHDGPGLRALTLIKLAHYLLDQGEDQFVYEHLYSPVLPAYTVIKRDLEYVARKWNDIGFDYWEEIRGIHFSTAMAHRKALLQGAILAKRLGDPGAAIFYETQAHHVSELVKKFWRPNENFIAATIRQDGGFYKSHLDISVILGVLHSSSDDGFYSIDSLQVLQTALKIEESFRAIYSINKSFTGVAIGRYPEDTYNGYETDKRGNPWFLATFAMAEYYLKLEKLVKSGEVGTTKQSEIKNLLQISQTTDLCSFLRAKAISFIKRADQHAARDGSMSEQMNRENGYMQGAKDLTWSYAAHLSMVLALY